MWTNLGKQRMFEEFFEASSVNTTHFMLQLASALPVPTDQVGYHGSHHSYLLLAHDQHAHEAQSPAYLCKLSP